MKIIFLEGENLGEDMVFTPFLHLGEVTIYPSTSEKEMPERVKDADIIVANKLPMCEETLKDAKNLKLVCLTATGINNLDGEYLKKRGIHACNVAGYSTDAVAQHTFAMLFYLLEHLRYYDDYVKDDHYTNDTIFTHFAQTFYELKGKIWGIIGLGNIGRRVAAIAEAFGAQVIYASPSGAAPQEGYHQVSLDTLLETSDIVSVHAPLNEHTEHLMNLNAFCKMKKSAIFLNLGRGPIVVEADLKTALETNEIQAAGLDVLCAEPMSEDNPLRGFTDSNRLLITPHIAWASIEARTKLMNIIAGQIKEFFGL